MNFRVVMLIAVTGTFIAAWSADRPSESAHFASVHFVGPQVVSVSGCAIECGRANRILPCEPTEAGPKAPRQCETGSNALMPGGGKSVSAMTANECPCPLPDDITVGRYRVLDSSGHTFTLSFTSEDADCLGVPEPSVDSDVYVSESGKRQWFFTRIVEPLVANQRPHSRRLDRSEPDQHGAPTSVGASTRTRR